MYNYLYRNKNNDIFSYYVESNILYEANVNTNLPAKAITRNVQPNISITFVGDEKPLLFFKPLTDNRTIKLCKFEDNYWSEQNFFTIDNNIEYFKVLQFHEKTAILFATKTNDKRLFDLFISFSDDQPNSKNLKIATIFASSRDLFKTEEISFGHYALIFKTLENKNIHLDYIEINSSRITTSVKIASSDYSITDDTYLFNDKSYFLYVKNKPYSQQLCLKKIADFNTDVREELVIFEGKNIEKPNMFLAGDVLYITFVSSRNTMLKSSIDNKHNVFSKMISLHENSGYFEKAKLIGYSLPQDNFKINNLYISKDNRILVLDKYCNIKATTQPVQQSVKHYEDLNKALKDENKMLKRQLRLFSQDTE